MEGKGKIFPTYFRFSFHFPGLSQHLLWPIPKIAPKIGKDKKTKASTQFFDKRLKNMILVRITLSQWDCLPFLAHQNICECLGKSYIWILGWPCTCIISKLYLKMLLLPPFSKLNFHGTSAQATHFKRYWFDHRILQPFNVRIHSSVLGNGLICPASLNMFDEFVPVWWFFNLTIPLVNHFSWLTL